MKRSERNERKIENLCSNVPRPPLYTNVLLCVYSRRAPDKSSIHVRRTTRKEETRKRGPLKIRELKVCHFRWRGAPTGPCSNEKKSIHQPFEIKLNCQWIFARQQTRDTKWCIHSSWLSVHRESATENGVARRGLNACVHLLKKHSSLLLTRP